jgi:TonB family protein
MDKKRITPEPDSDHQRLETTQPRANQFNSRLLLKRGGLIQSLLSNLRDYIVAQPVRFARATPTAGQVWMKDENFNRSQVVSFAVHGGLAMLLLLSLTGKLPIPASLKPTLPTIFAPDPAEIRFLIHHNGDGQTHGSGSGGELNPIPVTVGLPAPFANREQIVPPSVIRNSDPSMSIPPTLVGMDQIKIISRDIDIWGDPNGKSRTDSNGPGCCSGMGSRKGSGIGDGDDGAGLGPGRDKDGYGNGQLPGGNNGIKYPECLYCPRPEYSEEARHNRYQGSVLLYVVVLPNGTAGRIEVVKSPGMGLDEKAIEAVRTWKFKAAIGPDGKPMAVVVPVEVAFQLF